MAYLRSSIVKGGVKEKSRNHAVEKNRVSKKWESMGTGGRGSPGRRKRLWGRSKARREKLGWESTLNGEAKEDLTDTSLRKRTSTKRKKKRTCDNSSTCRRKSLSLHFG